VGPRRHRRAVKFKRRIAFGAALSGWRIDGVALGAFHYFRGVLKARAIRTLRLPCCEIKRVCRIFLQVPGEREVFLPCFALAFRNIRLACEAHSEPSRWRWERGQSLRWRASGPAGAVGRAWFLSQKVLGLLPILNPLSRHFFLVGFVAACRDQGSFFRMHSGQRPIDRDAGRASVIVLSRFVPICPEVPIAPAASLMHDVRSCFYLSGGVCLASPRALSDRTSLTRFLSANAPANS